MSDNLVFFILIKSSKYGTNDEYSFQLDRGFMRIERSSSHSITCIWQEGSTPIWQNTYVTEYSQYSIKEPLLDMLNHEGIYAPAQIMSALERAWFAWRKKELSDEQVKIETMHLFNWIDKINENKPSSEFWKNAL